MAILLSVLFTLQSKVDGTLATRQTDDDRVRRPVPAAQSASH